VASASPNHTRHGDNHDLWIDPSVAPQFEGNDGGRQISFTAANLGRPSTTRRPRSSIASTDTSIPTASTARSRTTPRSRAERSEWGVITLADCTYSRNRRSGFIAVNPKEHNVVYIGAIARARAGSGAAATL